MIILNASSDKYNLNHVIVFSKKPIACNLHLEEFHDQLHQRHSEDK